MEDGECNEVGATDVNTCVCVCIYVHNVTVAWLICADVPSESKHI